MSSQPLRIVFLATLPPNSSTIVGRTIPLALELQKKGHQVSLVTLGKISAAKENSPIPVIIAGPAFRDGTRKPNIFTLVSRYYAAKKGLTAAVRAQQPDLIILVKPHPQNFAAVKKINIPFVLDSDDDEASSSRSSFIEKIWLKRINKNAARKAHLISACSPFLVEQYQKLRPGKNIAFIPTGLSETATTNNTDLRRYFGIAADAQIILYLGSLSLSSGHRLDQFFNVWNELSTGNLKLHFIAAGDGIDAEKIIKQTKLLSNNNRIHFFGRFAAADAENFARQANLLIDPVDNSIANQAKSSSRALLALKTGTPIITAGTGMKKVLLPENIHQLFFYEPLSPDMLVKAIKFGLTPEARDRFSTATQGLWKQWTYAEIGAKFSSLIEETAK